MHFSIYLNDQLAHQLSECAQQQGITRNRLVSKVLEQFVQKDRSRWSEDILHFKGVPTFPAFEETRNELLHAPEDPLA